MFHSEQAIVFTRQAGSVVLTSAKKPASEASAPDVPDKFTLKKLNPTLIQTALQTACKNA
ncbi:hypothetical protein CF204P1_35740 [Citrobacter freundii]|nr:hypothetical protein CF204P1_35740 [Citrobacter freundii]